MLFLSLILTVGGIAHAQDTNPMQPQVDAWEVADDLAERLQTAERDLRRLQRDDRADDREIARLEREIDALRGEIQQLSGRLQEVDDKYAGEVTALRDILECDEEDEEDEGLLCRVDVLEDDMDDLKLRVATLEAESRTSGVGIDLTAGLGFDLGQGINQISAAGHGLGLLGARVSHHSGDGISYLGASGGALMPSGYVVGGNVGHLWYIGKKNELGFRSPLALGVDVAVMNARYGLGQAGANGGQHTAERLTVRPGLSMEYALIEGDRGSFVLKATGGPAVPLHMWDVMKDTYAPSDRRIGFSGTVDAVWRITDF